MKATVLRAAIVVALPLFCLSAVAAEGPLAQKKGQGGSEIQGSAGPGGSQGDNGLEHCDKAMGALTVVEPQDYVAQSLSRYGLESPTGLIRMMVQQSNCFLVVERGIGMQNMMQERALQESGELRQNSNMGGGQMISADFILTPAVVFSENNAGGVGGALGGLLGGKSGSVLGAVAGGLKFKEAQTSMLVADARSGLQVAAAEGSSKKADLRLGAALFGGGAAGGLGGYANTNEGKVTIVPKIANVKLYGSPADSGKALATLSKGDEMIFMGEEQNGFLKVESGSGSGWVKKVLVSK